jgi:hypothetical protein
MKDKARTILAWIPRLFNVFMMLISPMVYLLLIVGFIMMLDTIGSHRRLVEKLEEVPHSTDVVITSCYEEGHYCFADFVDENGIKRYGKLDWRYYPEDTANWLATLERDDVVRVRYADYRFEDNVVLAEYYGHFLNYKGHLVQNGGIILVCWLILIIHPEVLLFSLVENMGSTVDTKWKRMTGQG